jgi:hypothetical protein
VKWFETDGDRAKKAFSKEVAAHADRVYEFRAEAKLAGFSEEQIEFMARFLAMADHSHQYYSNLHWNISSSPVDGKSENREE